MVKPVQQEKQEQQERQEQLAKLVQLVKPVQQEKQEQQERLEHGGDTQHNINTQWSRLHCPLPPPSLPSLLHLPPPFYALRGSVSMRTCLVACATSLWLSLARS